MMTIVCLRARNAKTPRTIIVEVRRGTRSYMAEYDRNSGKHWTAAEVATLRKLANQNTPTRVIGLKLGRTEAAVRAKASEEGISLEPHNRPPYNRR